MSRELGHGGRWPDVRWPNGARFAVSLVLNLEEGAGDPDGDGDPRSEPMGKVISVVEPGRPEPGREQTLAYGLRAGFRRMPAALERASLPATIFFWARAAERSLELANMLVERGREVACHGWRWPAGFRAFSAIFWELKRGEDRLGIAERRDAARAFLAATA